MLIVSDAVSSSFTFAAATGNYNLIDLWISYYLFIYFQVSFRPQFLHYSLTAGRPSRLSTGRLQLHLMALSPINYSPPLSDLVS